jgi:hypothetical protein
MFVLVDPLLVRFGGPTEYLAFGRDGWAWVNLPAVEDIDKGVWVQVVEDLARGGRLIVRSLWVELMDGVTGRALDSVRLGSIEAALNAPGVAERLRQRVPTVTAQEQHAPSHVRLPNLPSLLELAPPVMGERLGRQRGGLRVRGAGTQEGKRPDDFYRRVAEIFSTQSTQSRHPAVDIANANDVEVSTVHRWLKEARRRGLLAPSNREGRK